MNEMNKRVNCFLSCPSSQLPVVKYLKDKLLLFIVHAYIRGRNGCIMCQSISLLNLKVL